MANDELFAIATPSAPAAIGPYSQAVVARGVVYCSGQIAIVPETGALLEGTIEEETALVMKNLGEVLKAAGSGFDRVVKVGIFLSDMGNFQAVNGVYAKHFEGRTPPARATVAVRELPKSVRVEIECTALTDLTKAPA